MASPSGQASNLSTIPLRPRFDQKDCPTCGQEIPPEKLEEIGGRIAAKERERTLEITALLEKRYAIEKAQAQGKARADLELEREQSAQREARAREEAREAAEKLANERLAEAEQKSAAREMGWQREIADAQAAAQAAVEISKAHGAEVEELKEKSVKTIEGLLTEAKEREVEIRNQAKQDAEAALAERIAGLEKEKLETEKRLQAQVSETEAARIVAEQERGSLQLQVDELRESSKDEIAKVKQEAEAELIRTRQAATEETEARMRETLAARENLAAAAEARALAAEEQLKTLADQHGADVEANLKAQRDVLEKAAEDAVNAEKSRAFEENQKLTNKVNDLQRALENKTAEELGEGAEVDLFESLKSEFPEDKIRRVPKGTPGADIIHEVMLCGKKCGTIIYDSKNHNQFRNEHVLKLRADQLAAGAEHAILSTRKFPQGTRQLHQQDGVLLANPARTVLVAKILRQHMLQLQTQRSSDVERESKTEALYTFIVSELCGSLLARIDERAEDLLDQQNKEIRWHDNNWKKQGEAIRGIQKAKADLENQINSIIGTSSNDAAA
jgi:hypothetical protein